MKWRGRSTRKHDFQPKCKDARRESPILNRNGWNLYVRARVCTEMRGCSTGEHDLQSKCEDAPRKSTIFNEMARTLYARAANRNRSFLHLGPPTLHVGPSVSAVRPAVYNFYSTQERSFQSERKDAPRESAVVNRNARTLHVRETRRNRLCFISNGDPCTSAAPRASSRFCISGRQPYRPVAQNQPLISKNVFASPTNASPAAAARSSSSNSTSRASHRVSDDGSNSNRQDASMLKLDDSSITCRGIWMSLLDKFNHSCQDWLILGMLSRPWNQTCLHFMSALRHHRT